MEFQAKPMEIKDKILLLGYWKIAIDVKKY